LPIYADRVQETTTTTGTGTVTVDGAVLGFRSFAAAVGVGETVRYVIAGGAEWEVGEGTLLTSNTLSRDTVISSSNAGSLVPFSAGSKNAFVDLAADDIQNIGLGIAMRNLRYTR
jgi:hypothetical protein